MKRAILLGLLAAACAEAPESAPESRRGPTVHVVNYPLQYFARRIGGDLVEVRFPAKGDPAFWKPDDATILAYQGSDLILRNGAGYAKWMATVSLPLAGLVDTSSGFRDRYIRIADTVTHSHGPAGGYEHGDVAFTTWLDLTLAVEQARAIRDAFIRRWPVHEATFESGFGSLERDLAALDASLSTVVPKEEPLLASHPVFQYWARRYGANLKSVHFEPDAMPDTKGWSELAGLLRDHPARWMIWEGRPLAETERRLLEMGVRCVVFDPCGNAPAEGDFLTAMHANVAALRQSLSGAR